MQQHKNVTLLVDIMKLNNIPFFMTISCQTKFGFTGWQRDHQTFQTSCWIIFSWGVHVMIILANNQINFMHGNIVDLGALLNVFSWDEHVPEVEQYNRTIKECVRANYNILPFTHFPFMFIIKMVYHSLFWCNMFFLQENLSTTQSPPKSSLAINLTSMHTARLNLENMCRHTRSMIKVCRVAPSVL